MAKATAEHYIYVFYRKQQSTGFPYKVDWFNSPFKFVHKVSLFSHEKLDFDMQIGQQKTLI